MGVRHLRLKVDAVGQSGVEQIDALPPDIEPKIIRQL
jgi:hypothetical protein